MVDDEYEYVTERERVRRVFGPGAVWVGEADLDDEPHRFDLVGVIESKEGYFVSTDSGCSCPRPWESHGSRDSWTGPMTAVQASESVEDLAFRHSWEDALGKYVRVPMVGDLRGGIDDLLRRIG